MQKAAATVSGRCKYLCGFGVLFPIQHTRQVEYHGQEQVEHVQNDGGLPVLKPAEHGGQEEGITLEEHVIRADGGIVDEIGGDGYDHGRNGREQHLPGLVHMCVAVVARGLHEHAAEQHDAVEKHGVRACKGQAGVVGEHVGGIEKVDGRPQKTQRAKISAARLFHVFIAPECKGHGIHKDAAGVKRQNTAPFKAYLVAADRLPGDLDNLPDRHGRPQHGHDVAHGFVIAFSQLDSQENDER